MDIDIGFLYQKDEPFAVGLKKFRETYPNLRGGFEALFTTSRSRWQNDLSDFRNHWIEHQQGDPGRFKKFYQPDYAEALFDAVWRTIADILPYLLELRFPPGITLREQSMDDPSPRWPNRFQFDIAGFKP